MGRLGIRFDKLLGSQNYCDPPLKAGAVDVLRGMVGPEVFMQVCTTYEIARFGRLALLVSFHLLLTPPQLRTEAHFQIVRCSLWFHKWWAHCVFHIEEQRGSRWKLCDSSLQKVQSTRTIAPFWIRPHRGSACSDRRRSVGFAQ